MDIKLWEVQTEESIKQGRKGIVMTAPDILTAAKTYTKWTKKAVSPEAKNIISIHQVRFDSETGGYTRLGIKSREQ